MNAENQRPITRGRLGIAASCISAVLVLSGCGGSVGENSEGLGEGFEYGASDDEVHALIDDLEPVTISYQPSAPSPESPSAPGGTVIKEAIEERSNGQITVDLVWGHAIAGYDEVHDALADGRVDMSHTLPSYHPDQFPAVDDFNDMVNFPSSPWAGELAANAASVGVGYETPEVMEDYEEKGLIPFAPTYLGGGYYLMCRDEVPTDPSDWQGLQVRVGSSSQAELVSTLGGSPVTVDRTEVYEALQRGTVDCGISQMTDAAGFGLAEVAPNIGYLTETGFPRVVSAVVGSPSLNDLPLAYQQIIYDSMSDYFRGAIIGSVDVGAHVVEQIKEIDGSFEELSPEVQELIADFNSTAAEETADEGVLDSDVYTNLNEAYADWAEQVSDFGYEDGGPLEEMDEWHEGDGIDYAPIADTYYENSALELRPEG